MIQIVSSAGKQWCGNFWRKMGMRRFSVLLKKRYAALLLVINRTEWYEQCFYCYQCFCMPASDILNTAPSRRGNTLHHSPPACVPVHWSEARPRLSHAWRPRDTEFTWNRVETTTRSSSSVTFAEFTIRLESNPSLFLAKHPAAIGYLFTNLSLVSDVFVGFNLNQTPERSEGPG